MTFKEKLYSALGDTWFSMKSVALWPWPAIVVEWPKATLTWDDYRAATAVIKPGDIMLSREDAFIFSNTAIPGRYKHAAVYTGALQGLADRKRRTIQPALGKPGARFYERTIVHAVSEGVLCQDFGELFFACDDMAVVRPWRTLDEQHRIVASALSAVGKAYDFEFQGSDASRFYCSELAAHCLIQTGIQPPPKTFVKGDIATLICPLKRWMREVYTADEFVRSYTNVARVGA